MSENSRLFNKYGVSQNAITKGILKEGLTTGDFDKYMKQSAEKAFKEGFKPSEIAEFKKQHESRLKKAQDAAAYNLKNRRGMSEYRKKSKGKASDTGSEYRSGGRVNLRGGGMSQRGLGKAFKDGGRS